MSAKRRATTDLNHDNWDKDEKVDEEEMGNFKMAPEDVLEKRVIKTARRRTKMVGDETKKPVFSGFSGFNKTQPSSFDFLASLTNGSKASNSSPAKTENSTQPHGTSESFGKISSGSIFTSPTSSNIINPTFGKQLTTSVSTFGMPSTIATTSVFGMPTSTVTTSILESPVSASVTSAFGTPSSNAVSSVFGTPPSTAVSSVFGTPPSTAVPSVFGTPSSTTVSSVFGSPSTTTSSVFGTSSITTSSGFGTPITTSSVFGTPSTAITSVFKTPTTPTGTSIFLTSSTKEVASVFGSSPSTLPTSVFGAPMSTASKADSTVNENPFKIVSTSATSSFITKPPVVSSSKITSSIFGTASSSFNSNKSLVTSSKSTPFQIKSSTNLTQTTNAAETKVDKTNGSNPNSEKIPGKKVIYCSKLRGLNESVSEWIIKHVKETPLCILTPIFKDYEAHLKKIQEEYEGKKDEAEVSKENKTKNISPVAKSPLNTKNTVTSHIAPITPNTPNTPKSIFGTSPQNTTHATNFSFGFTSTPGTNTTSTGFSFGVSSTQSTTTTTSPFAISNSASNTNGKAPFSFGIEKPFNFNSNIKVQSNTEKASENPEEDEPPKVEFTPVVEENSVFDKRCKIFVKKDGNFVDKGVGTLYVKKIQDSTKYQLLVRANTNLGNVLLNLILSSSIPTQRMGKNNVMLVCVPTPEAKPPPVPVIIRVKTSEEADDLLKTLDEYKV